MLMSASALPLLAVLALLLRKNLFKGKLKLVFLVVGLCLLSFAVFDTFKEHRHDLSIADSLVAIITSCITLFILSHFNHNHEHAREAGGATGIVISEAFHSLIDGAVIGATYLVTPLLGYAATVGIIMHELPKIIGTITILRSFNLSIRTTIMYGIFAQIGSPLAAILIYLLGSRINHEQFQALEIASVSSLAAIVLWIIYLEIRYHIHHKNHDH
jgi:zinc and cadmium transporter